jgi:DNA-binding MarR family transcriptional regulator
MQLTTKQLEILRVVTSANVDGSLADLDEILERLSYKPTKEAIHFSIRALIAHGLIEKLGSEKRRGRRHVLIGITALGKHFVTPIRDESFVMTEAEYEDLEMLNSVIE